MSDVVHTDVLVIGTGAAAFVAALKAARAGADVLMVEKGPLWGGTSATSGGSIWVPHSDLAAEQGQADDPEDAYRYLRALSADNVSDERIEAFVAGAPAMLRWLTETLGPCYFPAPYPDYYPDVPGNRTGYRTHHPIDFEASRLSSEAFATMQRASPAINLFGRINVSAAEMWMLMFRQEGWIAGLLKILARYYLDLPHRLKSSGDRRLTWGTAILARLRAAYDAAGGRLWLNAPFTSLLSDDGRVTGATIRRNGSEVVVRASKGVILATGGFERNRIFRELYLDGVAEPERSGSQVNNAGDGLVASEALGVATINLDAAWWAPVIRVPGQDRSWLCTMAKALPHSIVVDQTGERYVNEAMAYHRFGQAMRQHGLDKADPSWLVFDATYRKSYPVGPILPGMPDLMLPRSIRRVLFKGRSLGDLARKIGVPADRLVATCERFNADAAQGRDAAFGRGDAAYDLLYGDPRHRPSPTLGPVERAPFYAVPLHLGDIGTCGGLATDEKGRALRPDASVVGGLYAVGNCAASVMGYSYPGAGATLGPAMTFGFLAAADIVGANSL